MDCLTTLTVLTALLVKEFKKLKDKVRVEWI